MPRTLPLDPYLEQLRNQAKDLFRILSNIASARWPNTPSRLVIAVAAGSFFEFLDRVISGSFHADLG